MQHIVVTANGPGEVAALVRPFVHALKSLTSDVTVTAALVPCVYATGHEAAVLAAQTEVDTVWQPADTLRVIRRGVGGAGREVARPGCVVHFGGEPLLSLALARRLGCPPFAYLEKHVLWARRFRRSFLRDDGIWRVLRPARCTVVGNLMVDAARMRRPTRRPARQTPPVIGIFAGSREPIVCHMLPFFLKVARYTATALPAARWLIGQADFVPLDRLAALAARLDGAPYEGDCAWLEAISGRPMLRSEGGIHAEVCPAGRLMAEADIVLTIPGTNTAELAALGVPMIVCVPSYWLAMVPLPGLLGHVTRIPLVGPTAKHAAVYVYGRGLRYLAIPNRLRRRYVVPELKGRITARQVADCLVTMLGTSTTALEAELRSIMGPPGAADRLAHEILTSMSARAPA